MEGLEAQTQSLPDEPVWVLARLSLSEGQELVESFCQRGLEAQLWQGDVDLFDLAQMGALAAAFFDEDH